MPQLTIAIVLFAVLPHASLRVVDSNHEPVAGAAVKIWMPPSGQHDLASRLVPLCEGVTAKDGSTTCSAPTLVGALLVVDAPRFEPLIVKLDGKPIPQAVLRPGLSLKGHIADAVGSARIEAIATINAAERNQTFRFERDGVDEKGDFVVQGLPASDVALRVDVDGFLPWSGRPKAGSSVNVKLQPGIAIKGHIREDRGRSVENAHIEQRTDAPAPRTASRPDGEFVVAVRSLPASLHVSAEGLRPILVEVKTKEEAKKLDLRLDRAEGIAGEIDPADGTPLPHCTVWVESRTADGASQVTPKEVTVDHGRFTVQLPAPGTYSFRIHAAGYESKSVSDVYVAPRTFKDLGRLQLLTGSGASGTLIDAKTSAPVAGATVELQEVGVGLLRDLRYHEIIRATSTADGEFVIHGAGEGSYLLRVQESGRPAWSKELSLGSEDVRDLGRILLGSGTEVKGEVVSRRGEAQPSVALRFFDEAAASASPLQETTTHNDGTFAGVRLSAGRYIVRAFSDRLLLSQPFEVRDGENEKTLDLEIPAVHVTGIVRRGGKPVAGGMLSLVEQLDPAERQGKLIMHGGGGATGTSMMIGVPASTLLLDVGPTGEFASDHVMPGVVTATYRADDGREWTRELSIPDAAAYEAMIDLGGASLDGAVVDKDGVVIPGVELTLVTQEGQRAATATSAGDGTFEFSDLQAGSYTILTRADKYRAKSISGISIADGSRPPAMKITLDPGNSGILDVTLTRNSGSPAEYVPVTLLNPAGMMVRSLPTDSSGIREFDDLPAGQYVAVWSDAYYGAGASDAISVAGDSPASFSRVLTPGARVRVVCGSPACSAKPVDSLNVLAGSGTDIAAYLSGVGVGMRLPQANGSLVLGTLAPGSYDLRIGFSGTVYERRLETANRPEIVVSLP